MKREKISYFGRAVALFVLSLVLTWTLFLPMEAGNVRAAEAQEITLSRTSMKMLKGRKATLKLLNAAGKVTWASTNKTYAEVTGDGVVTAKKAGIVTIAAFHKGIRYNCRVTIEDPKLSASQMTLIKGQKRTIRLNGTTQTMKWSSSNAAVASVSAAGCITAKKTGTAVISATVYGKKFSCRVKVETPSLSATKLTMTKGESKTLVLRGNTQAVKWSSSKTAVAAVTSKGVVSAKGVGTAVITAAVGGKKYTCTVTVKKPVSTVAGNYEKLLAAIKKKGGRDSKGFLALMSTEYGNNGEKYFTELAYNPANKKFVFKTLAEFENDGLDISVETRLVFTDKTYKTAIAQVDSMMPRYNEGFGLRTRFATAAYNGSKNFRFNVAMKTSDDILDGATDSDLQEIGNAYLKLSFKAWSGLLRQKTNLTMRDLGFTSYR